MFTALSILVLVASLPVLAGSNSCPARLTTDSLTEAFRAEVLDSSNQFHEMAEHTISRLENKTDPEVGQAWNTSASAGKHIIYLASGPDVFRAVYDFPLATNIHLIDSMNGWGNGRSRGPLVVFNEIESRLNALAKGGSVTIVRRGLLAHRPLVIWPHLAPWPKNPQYQSYKQPIVWELNWTSPSLGSHKLWVWLHVTNYNDPEDMQAVLDTVPPRNLGGVLLAGAHLPRKTAFRLLNDRIVRGGSFIVEFNWVDGSGIPAPHTPPRDDVTRYLDQWFDLAAELPISQEVLVPFRWTTYHFQKR